MEGQTQHTRPAATQRLAPRASAPLERVMDVAMASARSRLDIDLGRVEHNALVLQAAARGGAATDVFAKGAGAVGVSGFAGVASLGRGGGRTAGGAGLLAVVKKNAYGLGAVPVVHRLTRAGVTSFAVYSPDEAEALLAASVTAPILVLMPMGGVRRGDALYRHAVAEKLHFTVHDAAQVRELNSTGQQLGTRLPIHLYVDTGMTRGGLSPEQCRQVLADTVGRRYLRIAGIATHFTSSEEDPAQTQAQLSMFDDLLKDVAGELPADVLRHAANTCGLLRSPGSAYDLVRPGLGLYGYTRTAGVKAAGAGKTWDDVGLQPVVRWVSRLIHVRAVPKGTSVGYGQTATLGHDAILGLVPVGYGDGYPLALSNQATARVQPLDLTRSPADCPVVGRVSMDQLVLDLTPLLDRPVDPSVHASSPAFLHDAEVELISDDTAAPHALPELARLADTHPYEMLCRLGACVPRRYVN